MSDAHDDADPAARKRRRIQRRAKRGLVAGYIHGLSVRHKGRAVPGPGSAEQGMPAFAKTGDGVDVSVAARPVTDRATNRP